MTATERLAKLNEIERARLANIVKCIDGSQPLDPHAAICSKGGNDGTQ